MRLVGASDIIGQLAANAVKQHPYHAPDGLFELVQETLVACRRDFKDGIEGCESRWFESSRDLYQWVRSILPDNHPILTAWNTRRSGRTGHAFVSRYGGPPPEDDFIDIDALRMNVASGSWRDSAEYEKVAAALGGLPQVSIEDGMKMRTGRPTPDTGPAR
jgi:hypothetical protein